MWYDDYVRNSFLPTPTIYNIWDNVQDFLEEVILLSAEAVKKYEEVEDSIDEYPERFRKAFEVPSNVVNWWVKYIIMVIEFSDTTKFLNHKFLVDIRSLSNSHLKALL